MLIALLFVVHFFVALFLICLWLTDRSVRIVLRGKHVLITGGSKGIGRALACESLRRGAKVSILARNLNALNEVKQELITRHPGCSIEVLSVDMTAGFEQVASAIRQAEERLGPVDMLINNAGGSVQGAFEQLPVDAFESQMRLNYLSAVHASRAVIPGMKQRRCGRIVFVNSMAGQFAIFGYTAYSAAKFAVRGFAEALQMELKPYDVRITLAYPPNTDTEGFAEERRTMPQETAMISGSAGLFQPGPVATRIIDHACIGEFSCNYGVDGWMLGKLTAGAACVTSVREAFQQVLLCGLFRFISLFYVKSFDHIVAQCAKQRDASSTHKVE